MTLFALVSNTDWYLFNFRLSLAKYLRYQGYRVVLISPPGEYSDNLQSAGFPWFAWDVGRKSLSPWSEWDSIKALSRLYRKIQPSLVHHHTIKPVLYGGIAAGQASVPAVVSSITGRGYVFLGQDARARALQQVVKPLYRQVLRRKGSHVIFENEGDREYFLNHRLVIKARSHLIESVGVDTAKFYPAPEPSSVPVILLASRMLWDKGVGIFVEAARSLQKNHIQARFILVGQPDPGNPTSITEEQIRLWEKEGLVEWWGWQPDMNSVYARANIVVLPSFHEGVPTGLLEAAACGRPIVATDIPGCRSVVVPGENGLLVPPRNVERLASALEQLILDPELRGRMGKAGRELVLKHFTHERINQQTLEVYRQALAPTATQNVG